MATNGGKHAKKNSKTYCKLLMAEIYPVLEGVPNDLEIVRSDKFSKILHYLKKCNCYTAESKILNFGKLKSYQIM